MDKFPEMRGHYLIMDNAHVHTGRIIGEMIIEKHVYKCIYLPSYSPELNPIEQFWSVVKSSVKRECILKKYTIPQMIADASNQVAQSSFEEFASYSTRCSV
jgi:transposase